jgi:glycosyltransferase involved in cell wall biosynthesis
MNGIDSIVPEFYIGLAFLPRYRRVVEESLKAAGTIIVYNDFIKQRINSYNDNIKVIPSRVDCQLFSPKERKEKNNNRLNIFMPSRCADPLKGFSFLYEACDLLRRKRNDFNLMICIPRIVPKNFKLHLEDYIRPFNWVSHKDLPYLYQKADICVVPSVRQELFEIVAVEAMACGNPVIASNIGGLQHNY